MSLEDEFGDIVLKARAGLGLSVDYVAREAGISKLDVTRLEAYGRKPTEEEVRKFSRILHLNSAKLMDIALNRYQPGPVPSGLSKEVRQVIGHIGTYEVKGYLFIDPATRDAAMVDTAFNPTGMIEAISQQKLNLKYILLTHTHQDHMGGVDQIRQTYKVPVCVSREEAGQLAKTWDSARDRLVKEGDRLPLGRQTLQVLQTPGHTPGGTGYVCHQTNPPVGFFGDAIFAGSLGRSYSTTSYPQLIQSVKNKILSLPRDTVLFPGHGPGTTVGEEIDHNPFFYEGSPE